MVWVWWGRMGLGWMEMMPVLRNRLRKEGEFCSECLVLRKM